MFFVDYGSAIANVDDVILSFKYFSFSKLVFKLGAEKSLEGLRLNREVSQQKCILVEAVMRTSQ